MKFKVGVSLKDLQPQMLVAILLAEQILSEICGPTVPLVVTSVNDGIHKDGSYHYKGRAFDIRTRHTGMARTFEQALKKELGHLGFDVVLEDFGGENEHIHVELDFRAGY